MLFCPSASPEHGGVFVCRKWLFLLHRETAFRTTFCEVSCLFIYAYKKHFEGQKATIKERQLDDRKILKIWGIWWRRRKRSGDGPRGMTKSRTLNVSSKRPTTFKDHDDCRIQFKLSHLSVRKTKEKFCHSKGNISKSRRSAAICLRRGSSLNTSCQQIFLALDVNRAVFKFSHRGSRKEKNRRWKSLFTAMNWRELNRMYST